MTTPASKTSSTQAVEASEQLLPGVGECPPLSDRDSLTSGYQPGPVAPMAEIDSRDFEESFGETLEQALDLDTWNDGQNLEAMFARLEQEVSQAVAQEDELSRQVRRAIFPLLAKRPMAPRGAGVFRVTPRQLRDTQVNVLFNGGVEACDASCAVHDTVPLTITQIGVCLVSYLGQQGAWGHRLYRKDFHQHDRDPLNEVLEALQRRQQRGDDRDRPRDVLSELARRAFVSYAERAVLLGKARAPWRMGRGQPASFELLTGSGSMEFFHKSLEVLEQLIFGIKRFVYVSSVPVSRDHLTIGHALQPLEFAIIQDSTHRLEQILTKGHLRGRHRKRAEEFIEEAGPAVLIGVYRTYAETPPQVFFAHADFAQDAALIAMADSLLQAQRAFPTLIDLAHSVCSSLFGSDGFSSTIEAAYARQGHPLRFLRQHSTLR
ncbi:MAG: hypothetical protein NZM29_08225 [Nitrospira sp.]|nr:hypothetical protein [Nitrospira sp.]